MRVFISHSSKNYCEANSLCSYLEGNGIPCWIAPRDIAPGSSYGDSIDSAFQECTAAVFLISSASLASTQVKQELYLANLAQAKGFIIIPVYIENVEIVGAFRYILHSKQAFFWNTRSADELQSIVNVLTKSPQPAQERYADRVIPSLRQGNRNFFNIYQSKYCDKDISSDIVPNVADFDRWLGDLSAITLIASVKLLWEKPDWNCLYIGKSGFGKTTGLFFLMKHFLEQHPDILVFYVHAEECSRLSGENKIAQYIFKHYVRQFNINIGLQEIIDLLEKAQGRTSVPQILLLLDGVSDVVKDGVTQLQEELDRIRINKGLQTIITASSPFFPISIGSIAMQRFDMQILARHQIDAYLQNTAFGLDAPKEIPYKILSNPLILTLYAKTNGFLKISQGRSNCYTRQEILSEADVLWNFLEMYAVRFADRQPTDVEKMKYAFVFRFILPKVAFWMDISNAVTVTAREFVKCAFEALDFLQDDAFCDVFEEYFGYEDQLTLSKIECKHILDDILVERVGLLSRSEFGHYRFSNSTLLNFFSAVHLYRQLILSRFKNIPTAELERTFLAHDTCRYLGELCFEHLNTPKMDSDTTWICPNRSTLVTQILELYRNRFEGRSVVGVSNLLQIIRTCRRNDISGLNLTKLDLRRTTFSQLICSRPTRSGTAAVQFDGSIIDKWTFQTVGYSGDAASLLLPEHSRAMVVSVRDTVAFLDRSTGAVLRTYRLKDDFIQNLAISPDGKRLLAAGMKSGIMEWDISTGEVTLELQRQYGGLLGRAAYLNDDEILYTTRSKQLYSYSKKTLVHRRVMNINACAFTVCNEKMLLLPSRAREIYEYDMERSVVRTVYSNENAWGSLIVKVRLTREEDRIIGCTKDGAVLEWQRDTVEPCAVYPLEGDINDFVMTGDEAQIYCICEQSGLIRIHRGSGQITHLGAPCEGHWAALQLDREESRVYFSSLEGTVAVYAIGSGEFRVLRHDDYVYELPYLHLYGCSFRNLNSASSISRALADTLRRQNAIMDS